MTTIESDLLALIAKRRDVSDDAASKATMLKAGVAIGYGECADELEAALTSAQSNGEGDGPKYVTRADGAVLADFTGDPGYDANPAPTKEEGEAVALQRYGRGPTESPWLLVPRDDGYWTPWHIAQLALDAAQPIGATSTRSQDEAAAWMTPEAIAHLARQNGVARADAWNCASGTERVPLYTRPAAQVPGYYVCNKCGHTGTEGPRHLKPDSDEQCNYSAAQVQQVAAPKVSEDDLALCELSAEYCEITDNQKHAAALRRMVEYIRSIK